MQIKERKRTKMDIKKIIKFEDASSEILNLWNEYVKDCYWLYKEVTDYFIIGDDNEIFVRTLNNGWFILFLRS